MNRVSRITKLLKDITCNDVSKRRNAAELLGGGDERAVYPLLKALRDENPGVQDSAMRSLISIGGEVTAYMVIPLLREDSYLRNTAIIILREIGAFSVPLLYSLLKDKDDDVRKFALDLIIDINQDVDGSKILPLLKDPNQNVRASAAKAIGLVLRDAAVPYLIDALNDDEWVVFSVLEALSKIGGDASAVPVLKLLESDSITLRFAAIEALGNIGSGEATDPLLGYFPKADEMEKQEVVKALVKIGITPSMTEISGILKDMLKTGEWDEKLIALRGITQLRDNDAVGCIVDAGGSLDPSDPESEDRLILIKEALREFGCSSSLVGCLEDPGIRFRGRVLAIETVGELKCRSAVPSLVKLIEGNLRDVRRASIRAIGEMSDDESRQVLHDAVSDHDSHVRKAAISAIGRIGDKASFDLLSGLLQKETYGDVIDEIIQALLALDQKALFSMIGQFDAVRKAVLAKYINDQEILIGLSGDSDLQVMISAVSGLGRIGTDASISRLKELSKSGDPAVKKAAVMAMGELRCCFDEIRAALRDEDMWVRLYAVKAIGLSEDPEVIDLLALMLNDRDLPVVLSAIDALAGIGGRDAFNAIAKLEEHENPVIREKAVQTLESL